MESGFEYILTDDSVLKFKNGEEVRGVDEVTKVILKCCESYHRGYMDELGRRLAVPFLVGSVVLGTGGLLLCGYIKGLKDKQKPEEK